MRRWSLWGIVILVAALAIGTALPGASAEAQTGAASPTATPSGGPPASPTATPVPGYFVTGSIPANGGFGLVVFSGGSYEQLVAASGCAVERVAFWVTVGGDFLTYVPGSAVAAPNAGFAAAFPNRTVPPFTALIGRCTPVSGSGVQGRVTLGPVCPVVSDLLPCPDQPYVATLLFRSAAGIEVGRATSGADGRYSIALPPGTYTLVPLIPSDSPFPRAGSQPVTVVAGRLTTADVTFDTGIRSAR